MIFTNDEILMDNIRELKPDYIITGSGAFEKIRESMLNHYPVFPDVFKITKTETGYIGRYCGIPLYSFSELPKDEIIFGIK